MKIYKNFISKIARMLKRKILNIFLLIGVNKLFEYLYENNWIFKSYHKETNAYYIYLHLLYIDRLHKNDDGDLDYIHVTLNLNMLLHAIISFFIFYILYKYNIQIISEDYIKYLQYIVYIFLFYAYGFWFVIQTIFGIYYWIKYEDKNILYKGINRLVYLLTILSNIFFICYILKIDLNLFLQYNILFVIDCTIILIAKIYCKLFNYNITLTRLVSFVYYLWIYMIICIILLVCTKKVRYHAIYFISELLCFLRHKSIQEYNELKKKND